MIEVKRIYGRTKELSVEELRKLFHDTRLEFIEVALLFGSRAKGKTHARSDYDFALLMRKDADMGWGSKARAYIVIQELTGLGDGDIDIVDLTHLSPAIKHTIKEAYIVLKGNEDAIARVLG